jgi:acyl-CoA synthetase (AMP-forming)/AMP-acid ligase II
VGGKTWDFLTENFDPSAPVVRSATGERSYADLLDAVDSVGKALADHGVPPHSLVGISGSGSFMWVAAYLALHRHQCVVALLPDAVNANVPERLRELMVAEVFPSQSDETLTIRTRWTVSSLEALSVLGADDSLIMLTSGSEKTPRAVRLTSTNISSNCEAIRHFIGLDERDSTATPLPPCYTFGLSVIHTSLRAGAALCFQSATFPQLFLDTLQSTGCSTLAAVPQTFRGLQTASTLTSAPIPALRKVLTAGGKMPADLTAAIQQAQPQAELYLMYGQTEATARISILAPADLPGREHSVGRGLPGLRLTVRREDASPAEAGEVGELYVEGPSVSPGYLDSPAANARTFTEYGLRTNDLARRDGEGFVQILGRRDGVLKVGGIRVSPEAVEEVLLRVPGVRECVVLGISVTSGEDRVHAFLATDPADEPADRTILRACAQLLPRQAVRPAVHRMARLPLTEHGKYDRKYLRGLVGVSGQQRSDLADAVSVR